MTEAPMSATGPADWLTIRLVKPSDLTDRAEYARLPAVVLREGAPVITVQALASLEGSVGAELPYAVEMAVNAEALREVLGEEGDIPLHVELSSGDGDEAVALKGTVYRDNAGDRTWLYFGARGKKLFRACYGPVCLKATVTAGNQRRELWSQPLIVDIDGPRKDALIEMVGTVLEGHWQYGGRTLGDVSGGLTQGSRDFRDYIGMVALVESAYRQNQAALRANPHTMTRREYRRGDFERLGRVTPRIAQSIITHPDDMEPAAEGFAANGSRYLPRKTLLLNSRRSVDCPENRAILGFLHTVIADVTDQCECLGKIGASDGAESDALGIIAGALRRRLMDLCARLEQLKWSYRVIFPFDPKPVIALPGSTAVFRRPGPYRRLYDVMTAWFTLGRPDYAETGIFLSLIDHCLYEYYALYRMADLLKARGFRFNSEASRRHEYPSPGKLLDKGRWWVYELDGCEIYSSRILRAKAGPGVRGEKLTEDRLLRSFSAYCYRDGRGGFTLIYVHMPLQKRQGAGTSGEWKREWDRRLRGSFERLEPDGGSCPLGELRADESRELEQIQEKNRVAHDNILEFEGDGEAITLYYQPVVYGDAFLELTEAERAGIPLRRLSRLRPLRDGGEDEEDAGFTGGARLVPPDRTYWLPDYLLRYRNAKGVERWLIADAKYRPMANVWNQNVGEFAFKYLLAMGVERRDVPQPVVVLLCGRYDPDIDTAVPETANDIADGASPADRRPWQLWIQRFAPGHPREQDRAMDRMLLALRENLVYA